MRSFDESDVELTIAPSPSRRWIMILLVTGLGILMVALAFSENVQSTGARLFFVLLAATFLMFVPQMVRRSELAIHMTPTDLFDSNGRHLCAFSEVTAVERGAFAFKPSNGFLLRLKTKAKFAWHPGIWWRFGRICGVGGVIPANQSKVMAEAIAIRISRS